MPQLTHSPVLQVLAALLSLTCMTATTSAQTPSATPSASPTQAKNEPKKGAKVTATANPIVVMETSMGTVEMEIFADKAPISEKNFMKYVDDKFYDGTIFHRVIDGFMIQGGGFSEDMKQKSTQEQIKNEATNGLKNEIGTLAMARTSVVDSATSQFFINVANNTFLNHTDPTPRGYGYAVFGKVVSGMDVIEKIKKVPTTSKGMHENVPVTAVVIKSMKRK